MSIQNLRGEKMGVDIYVVIHDKKVIICLGRDFLCSTTDEEHYKRLLNEIENYEPVDTEFTKLNDLTLNDLSILVNAKKLCDEICVDYYDLIRYTIIHLLRQHYNNIEVVTDGDDEGCKKLSEYEKKGYIFLDV